MGLVSTKPCFHAIAHLLLIPSRVRNPYDLDVKHHDANDDAMIKGATLKTKSRCSSQNNINYCSIPFIVGKFKALSLPPAYAFSYA